MTFLHWFMFACGTGCGILVGWSLGKIIGHGQGVICKPCQSHRTCPKCGSTSIMS